MERFNAIQSMARTLEEKAHDNMLLLDRARGIAAQSAHLLREEHYALAEQRQDLMVLRSVEVRTIVSRLKRTVHQTAIFTGRKVSLEVSGEDVRIDAGVLHRLVEPLLHLLRNAVDHGIETADERRVADKPETGAIRVDFARDGQNIVIRIIDDGRGLDLRAIARKAIAAGLIAADASLSDTHLQRLVLLPGFSTRDAIDETSGRGIGLDIVNDRILQLSGQLEIDSVEGFGCHFTLRLPALSGARHALLVSCNELTYALPSQNVQLVIPPGIATFTSSEDRLAVTRDGQNFRAHSLSQWLDLEAVDTALPPTDAARCATVILRGMDENIALIVDSAQDFRELMVQGVGRVTHSLGGLQGVAVMPDGSPVFVLDLPALARAAGQPDTQRLRSRPGIVQRSPSILVVDDSWAIRLAMKQLLEDAGYRVATASDGSLALESIRQVQPDLVIADLEMPHMNGLELARKLRDYPLWAGIPMIMLSSRSAEKHQLLAFEAGVTQYLTKPYQNHELLRHVRNLLNTHAQARTLVSAPLPDLTV
jgi:chemosensory pili system protein ChpA (sensor histidine kinase/response regulator)